MLNESHQRFLNKRQGLIRLWKWVGIGTLLGVIVFWDLIFFKQPLLFNPAHIVDLVENGNLDESSLVSIARIGSVGLLICGFLLMFIVLFVFVSLANEARYIRIIDLLKRAQKNTT